jgi:hypothetical protein
MAKTKRIRQPRAKQPSPFFGGGASTQVFMRAGDWREEKAHHHPSAV